MFTALGSTLDKSKMEMELLEKYVLRNITLNLKKGELLYLVG